MSTSLGRRLKIRGMVYVAGEPISHYWPMRTFIHHNPLHGLEHLPFAEALEEGSRLLGARTYLPRRVYQDYLAEGRVDHRVLADAAAGFAAGRQPLPGVDLAAWLLALLTRETRPVHRTRTLAGPDDVHAALTGRTPAEPVIEPRSLVPVLEARLLEGRPVYEAVDDLYGTGIGPELDALVVKGCLDFFDEGQSAWGMPGREQGLFRAWREVARRNVRLFLRGMHISRILAGGEHPEDIIAHVLETLGVPEQHWPRYFSRELARLHGWAGFISWRSGAKHYYWARRYPADLVDFLAVRLTLALALLKVRGRRRAPWTVPALATAAAERPAEVYLRLEFHGASVLPDWAQRVEDSLARGHGGRIATLFARYAPEKRRREAADQAERLRRLAALAGQERALDGLSREDVSHLLASLEAFERLEGMTWLRALESRAMGQLEAGLNLSPEPPRDKRPFVQALFCIDTRSERIRRHLEAVGDYQTFGIAGFFGVPVSFMGLGKGSETHLCPVLLTPKHLVLEMTPVGARDEPALTALEKAMHGLKESVLTPFVTVEAIGLLFGFDMVGKTLTPRSYNRWRRQLHGSAPPTRLLLDKLGREQADSIVRAVQRAVIVKAVEQEFDLAPERITDDLIRELREAALGNRGLPLEHGAALGLERAGQEAFVTRLRDAYRINAAFAQLQMEQLGRIGFTVDEQVGYVAQALRAIGLTRGFSRFVLLVGHGSTSENNPYDSALQCGACGGNQGLVSARVLAQMANRAEVRRGLRRQGIDIADDAWFVPALHDTTSDQLQLHDLDLLPPSHLVYLDRLRNGLAAASRRCARERLATLDPDAGELDPAAAYQRVQRNAMDWSQVRPEWGLSGNAYFIIGRRILTAGTPLEGRAFLHSYDYRLDPRRRLLENILTGPLVVGQWINMEHYFSTVDNECFGSGSKVYHNVAGRFGVMTGNLSDLRTGLPAQTVLRGGEPYHQPVRLITLIEAPLEHARLAIERVVTVKHLVENGWIRLLVLDPQTLQLVQYEDGRWQPREGLAGEGDAPQPREAQAS